MTGNVWVSFDLGACEGPPKPNGNRLPCLSLFDLYSFVQCWPLLHLLHNPRRLRSSIWVMPRRSIIPRNALSTIPSQMAHSTAIKTFGVLMFLHTFGIASPTQASVLAKRLNIGCGRIHLSIGADLIFKVPSTFLHSKLALSKIKDSMSTSSL